MSVEWMVAAPNPDWRRSHRSPHDANAGQRGWRTHAVAAHGKESLDDVKHRVAACGLRSAHGWTIDMFIEAKCKRCEAAMARKEAKP